MTSAPSSPARLRYLDHGSSEPLHPRAAEVLQAALEQGYADPLRLHGQAREARLLLENATDAVAEALGVRRAEVTFTSSGTAAVHAGVVGLLLGRARHGRTLAHSAVEHSAVLAAGRWWAQVHRGELHSLPVDAQGRLADEALSALSDLPPAVLAVQQANPEVGTLQPLDAVGRALPDVPLFVDACATGARLALPPSWSAAALSAHKWGGPAGVGVLLVRTTARWRSPFPTDDRVDPRVSGFEDVPGRLAAAAALQARVAEREELNRRNATQAARLRDALGRLPDVQVHGDPDPAGSLPHLVSFSCLYVDGEALVTELDRRGFAVASGSACTSSVLEPSHVLVAMGALTHGNARVTFGRDTEDGDVEALVAVLPGVLDELRARLR